MNLKWNWSEITPTAKINGNQLYNGNSNHNSHIKWNSDRHTETVINWNNREWNYIYSISRFQTQSVNLRSVFCDHDKLESLILLNFLVHYTFIVSRWVYDADSYCVFFILVYWIGMILETSGSYKDCIGFDWQSFINNC